MKPTDTQMAEQIPYNRSGIPFGAITLSIIPATCVYLAMVIFADLGLVLKAAESIPGVIYTILIGLSLVSYSARFVRWLNFLRPIKTELSVRDHATIYFAGFALTTTPGKAGETIRSLYLRPSGIDYQVSLAAFFTERLLDVLAVAALAMLALDAVVSTVGWFLGVVLVLFVLFFLLRSRRLAIIIKHMSNKRLGELAGEFQSSVSQFLTVRSLYSALPLSIIAWACQGVSLVLIVSALGFEGSSLVIVGIYCLSILAGAASFIPGGIGATEAAIALLLAGLGMDPAQAVAASIVSRMVTLWFAIAVGLLALTILAAKKPVSGFS